MHITIPMIAVQSLIQMDAQECSAQSDRCVQIVTRKIGRLAGNATCIPILIPRNHMYKMGRRDLHSQSPHHQVHYALLP
jgi:hypothetical protein